MQRNVCNLTMEGYGMPATGQYVYDRNAQVKIEFGFGVLIFGRVILLELRKNRKFHFPFIIFVRVAHI
jgi:hypothetical protein